MTHTDELSRSREIIVELYAQDLFACLEAALAGNHKWRSRGAALIERILNGRLPDSPMARTVERLREIDHNKRAAEIKADIDRPYDKDRADG